MTRPTPPLLKVVAELFYPSNCVGCGLAQASGILLCDNCKGSNTRISHPFCSRCSRPFDGEINGIFCCPNCEDEPLAFDCAISVWQAQGLLRELIHRFKYGGHFYLRRLLAEYLLDAIRDDRITSKAVDAFVPVPLHPARRRERGFNQAAALAEIVSEQTETPVQHCLERRYYTKTQTQFDRIERRRNLRNAFALRKNTDVAGKNLVLVDDVLTTGSTLHECALVLRQANVASVRAITVARG